MSLCKKGKFDLINEDLAEYCTSISTDMLELLCVNDLWINIKHVLSTTMKQHIPTKFISHDTNIQWLRKLINELQDVNVEPTSRLRAQMLQVIGKFMGNLVDP